MFTENLRKSYQRYVTGTTKLQDVSLLAIRLVLAYGFYLPAIRKVQNMNDIIDWFASLGIPLPAFNAYLATSTELLGIILLTLGLGVRIITIPLIITMIVAIITVHGSHGFEAGNNGFEIPLYYILMLFALLTFGAGKYSIDAIAKK
jgi:putative oxidoreductase